MNTSMLINALNGIMVDGDFIRIEELDDLTFECDHCGERHLRSGMNEWHDVDGESWCDECFTDDAFICDRCGEAHSIEDVYTVNTRTGTEYYCESCADWYTAICEECGERYETDDMTYLANGNYVCDDCRDEYYSECDECGEWFRTDDMTEVRSGDLVCDGCLDSEYSYCDECCEFVPNSEFDDDLGMCDGCAERLGCAETDRLVSEIEAAMRVGAETTTEDSNTEPRSSNAVVRPYHSRPSFRYFGYDESSDEEFAGMGAELEVDCIDGATGYRQRALNRIDRIAGDRVYFNSDCSLHNGFEIITHPHTLEAFNEIPWEGIMDACKENGYSSHDAGTCGLHFHFSRRMFGCDTETQDDNISKLVQFFEFYWDELVKASRREGNQLRWCNKKGYISKKRIKDYVKEKWGGHDEAINNGNPNTVEIRIMRGTLNVNSFKACADLCVNLVKNACRINWDEVCEADEMLKGIKPETARYLYNRGAFRDIAGRMM